MKHVTEGIGCYRVQCVYPWNRLLFGRRFRRSDGKGLIWPTRPWRRTWQAEWEGCEWAPRAYTESGIRRRAERWHRHGGRPGWQIALHRWVRRNVTQWPGNDHPTGDDDG